MYYHQKPPKDFVSKYGRFKWPAHREGTCQRTLGRWSWYGLTGQRFLINYVDVIGQLYQSMFCHMWGILDISECLWLLSEVWLACLYLAIKNFCVRVDPQTRKLWQDVNHFVRFDVVNEDIRQPQVLKTMIFPLMKYILTPRIRYSSCYCVTEKTG